MTGKIYVSALVAVSAVLKISGICASAQPMAVEYSNRISLADPVLIAGFEDSSLDGFRAGQGVELR